MHDKSTIIRKKSTWASSKCLSVWGLAECYKTYLISPETTQTTIFSVTSNLCVFMLIFFTKFFISKTACFFYLISSMEIIFHSKPACIIWCRANRRDEYQWFCAGVRKCFENCAFKRCHGYLHLWHRWCRWHRTGYRHILTTQRNDDTKQKTQWHRHRWCQSSTRLT